ncbi:MAG: VOC family protein [Chloroflexi bacterium]|nr:VOC family protein [Chloroflexota bacterium]
MPFYGVVLEVPNLAKTRAFYEGPLGLKAAAEATDEAALFTLGRTALRFVQGAPTLRPSLLLTIAIPAAQFEAAMKRLAERAPMLERDRDGERIFRPADRPGPSAYLRDVAGNLLEFAALPSAVGQDVPPLSITRIGLPALDLMAVRGFLQDRLGLRAGVAEAGQVRLEGRGRTAFSFAETGSSWLPGERPIQPSPMRASMSGSQTACVRLPGHPYCIDMLRPEELGERA